MSSSRLINLILHAKVIPGWLLLSCLSFLPGQSYAAWYEAQGQAVVISGDRERAKEQATNEAIKQALLFAGASIRSVQTLTNGLLQNDAFQIAANGEIDSVELVSETWHDDYVTVTIRADVVPKTAQCEPASYLKTIATSFLPLQNPLQAQDGQLHKIGAETSRKLKTQFDNATDTVIINYIAPYTARWDDVNVLRQAPALARQSKAQFILAGTITDISVSRTQPRDYAFWENEESNRHFGLDIQLIDGMNGATLLRKHYATTAPWQFDRFAQIDTSSHTFWQSSYGHAVSSKLSELVADVAETLICHPATGRVLKIYNDKIQVSIGREHGIKVGDELSLYQTNIVEDAFGQGFLQYRLYPGKVKVVAAFADTATVEAVGDFVLANIQPNDFVAKR
ncbi:flagellar assembly protein T N-terminal domain-containing protein [Alteromonas sp. ASW11-130]|uniref:flagellar assembly protein T N-terminal domain-containing protein n=1 Tax=Alteromonas sp. ASW11-130 TaxID=3015775 RepID=UPI0022429D77|nr:flagellar assembly protein T N-terminal domain-containing protein [Alteromonas sp. ASW11-130]MCW8091823.1 flagellar assembly protein FlgT [Alteromonas sp. ASW11-130]